MKAEILCVGTELLLGDIVNTNAAFLSKELARLGINVYHQSVVGDNSDRLKTSLKDAIENNDIVITSGGLGPTYDDITKETAAELFGLELEFDEESMKHINEYYEKINRTMTQSVRKQAYIPKGAIALKNDFGTAPGIYLEKNGKVIILLPGPPREIKPMFLNCAVPLLKKLTGSTMFSRTVHIFDVGESLIETKLREMMTTLKNPTVAPYAKDGEVLLRITASAESVDAAKKSIEPVINQIREIIGDENIYGIDSGNLQTALVTKLKEKKLKIATAESLTGGLVSKRITEVAGASEVLECGVCSYSNRIKHEVLGVSAETLEKYTEYSDQTAVEMAEGVRRLSGADIGVSTTGIAGPGGGTKEKSVGLVYVGISTKNKSFARELRLSKGFPQERELIRYLASSHALFLALKEITGK